MAGEMRQLNGVGDDLSTDGGNNSARYVPSSTGTPSKFWCTRGSSLGSSSSDSDLSEDCGGSSSESYFTAVSDFSDFTDDESVFNDEDISSSSSTKWWSFSEDNDFAGDGFESHRNLQGSPAVLLTAGNSCMNRCDSKDFSEHESGFFESNGDSDDFDEVDDCNQCNLDMEEQDKLWMEFQANSLMLPYCRIPNSLGVRRPPKPPPTIRVKNTKKETKKSVNGVTSSVSHPDKLVSCEKHGRKVRFRDGPDLVTVHHLIAWDFAYRASRKGPWEEYARDRDRFQKRIEETAKVVEICLIKKLKQISCPVT